MSVNTDQTAELESLPLAFSDEDLGDGQILLACPVCGHDYNHHGAAASFTRDGGEDGPSQITTTAPISQIALRDNPSSRRHAIRVAMSGECGHTWYLDIIQHKGQTFLGAVTTPSERSHPAFSDAQTDRT